jgi:hypothetical protein
MYIPHILRYDFDFHDLFTEACEKAPETLAQADNFLDPWNLGVETRVLEILYRYYS